MSSSPHDVYLVLRDEEDQPVLPATDAPIAYLMTADGPMILHQNPYFRAVVPAKRLPMLAEVPEGGESLLPQIPAVQVAQIVNFFREIFMRFRSEAVLVILYSEATRTYALTCPEQVVSASRIDYEMPQTPPPGFEFVGTVHSHASGAAGHSGTDTHDEQAFDGLHLTLGKLDRPAVDVSASLMVGGKRFPLNPHRCLAGLHTVYESSGTPRLVPRLVLKLLDTWKTQLNDDAVACFATGEGLHLLFGPLAQFFEIGAGKSPTTPEFKGYTPTLPEGADLAQTMPDPAWYEAVAPDVSVFLTDFRKYMRERVDALDAERMAANEDPDAPSPAAPLVRLLHLVREKEWNKPSSSTTSYSSSGTSSGNHASTDAGRSSTQSAAVGTYHHTRPVGDVEPATSAPSAASGSADDQPVWDDFAAACGFDDHGSLQPSPASGNGSGHGTGERLLTAPAGDDKKVTREM